MGLFNPQRTAFDLSWRMFGIHVRVSPWFWIFNGIFGWSFCVKPNGNVDASLLATWMVCCFASVLFHELGHVVMGRMFGQRGNIILSFGGAAIGEYHLCRPWQQIVIALGGPAAGLLLWGVVWLLVMPYNLAVFGMADVQGPFLLNRLDPIRNQTWLWSGADFLLLMNFLWSVLNLVPVIPLDGGQVVRSACGGDTSPSRLQFAFGLSFAAAVFIAVWSFMARGNPDIWYPATPSWATLEHGGGLDPTFSLILFGVLAVQSFITMQQIRAERRRWHNEREYDRDW